MIVSDANDDDGPRLDSRGLWTEIKSQLRAPEYDTVKRAIGDALIDRNQDLWRELMALEEILNELQLDDDVEVDDDEDDDEDEIHQQHNHTALGHDKEKEDGAASVSIVSSRDHRCHPPTTTSQREGLQDEIRLLVNHLHQEGKLVMVWIPSHTSSHAHACPLFFPLYRSESIIIRTTTCLR